jgi:hypothetical protein
VGQPAIAVPLEIAIPINSVNHSITPKARSCRLETGAPETLSTAVVAWLLNTPDFLFVGSTPLAYNHRISNSLFTIVETRPFIQDAKSRLADEERVALINMIAADPTCGVIMEGTGGVSKVRFRVQGRGKSSGMRVVYYFHNETLPIFCWQFSPKMKEQILARQSKTNWRN